MPEAPLYTIGIPTFNRPGDLRRALASAVAQTYGNVEVVVSDNSDSDESKRVVRGLGDSRIRYHRNPSNIGLFPNFLKVLELARGDYFSWLQDDDLLHGQFAERAVGAFAKYPDAPAYTAFSVCSPTLRAVHWPTLYGPPVPLDWGAGGAQVVPGSVVPPISLFTCVSTPPTLAFRRPALSEHASLVVDQKAGLFVERILLSAVCKDRPLAADPFAGGFWRSHPEQATQHYERNDRKAAHFRYMAEFVGAVAASARDDYRGPLRDALTELPDWVLDDWLKRTSRWPMDVPICRTTRDVLVAVLTDRRLGRWTPSKFALPLMRAKMLVRDLCPPAVYRAAAAARRRLTGRP